MAVTKVAVKEVGVFDIWECPNCHEENETAYDKVCSECGTARPVRLPNRQQQVGENMADHPVALFIEDLLQTGSDVSKDFWAAEVAQQVPDMKPEELGRLCLDWAMAVLDEDTLQAIVTKTRVDRLIDYSEKEEPDEGAVLENVASTVDQHSGGQPDP